MLALSLSAACARTGDEWAADLESWDPLRCEAAIAALGRVEPAEVESAAHALLTRAVLRNDATRARYTDSLRRLCRQDFEVVARVCSRVELDGARAVVVLEALRTGADTGARFLRFVIATGNADSYGEFLPVIGESEAEVLLETVRSGPPSACLRAMRVLGHVPLREARRVGALSDSTWSAVTAALQELVDATPESGVPEEPLHRELRVRALLELIAVGVLPIRRALDLTPDELVCLAQLSGDAGRPVAQLASDVLNFVTFQPQDAAASVPAGVATFLDGADAGGGAERALAVLARVRASLAPDGGATAAASTAALAALDDGELVVRIAGLLALTRIARAGDELPQRVSELMREDTNPVVREWGARLALKCAVVEAGRAKGGG